MKNGLFRSEQRTVSKTQTTISGMIAQPWGKPLTAKSPIQVVQTIGSSGGLLTRRGAGESGVETMRTVASGR
jgi:hypothetical protein